MCKVIVLLLCQTGIRRCSSSDSRTWLKLGLRRIEVFSYSLKVDRSSFRCGRSSIPRIDQSRYVTKLPVTDARIISGIVRLYLLHCGRLAAASRFNDRKTRKRNIRHISDVYTRWPLSMKRAILSFLKTQLCRIPTVYFVSRIMDFAQVDVCLSTPVENCNFNLSEILRCKMHISQLFTFDKYISTERVTVYSEGCYNIFRNKSVP